jgi:hypothetical protein
MAHVKLLSQNLPGRTEEKTQRFKNVGVWTEERTSNIVNKKQASLMISTVNFSDSYYEQNFFLKIVTNLAHFYWLQVDIGLILRLLEV